MLLDHKFIHVDLLKKYCIIIKKYVIVDEYNFSYLDQLMITNQAIIVQFQQITDQIIKLLSSYISNLWKNSLYIEIIYEILDILLHIKHSNLTNQSFYQQYLQYNPLNITCSYLLQFISYFIEQNQPKNSNLISTNYLIYIYIISLCDINNDLYLIHFINILQQYKFQVLHHLINFKMIDKEKNFIDNQQRLLLLYDICHKLSKNNNHQINHQMINTIPLLMKQNKLLINHYL